MGTTKKRKGEIKMGREKWTGIGIIGLVALFLASTTAGAANRDFNKIDTVRIGILAPVQMPVGHGDH